MIHRIIAGLFARQLSCVDAKDLGDGVGIAVKKGNPQLRQTIDYALAELAARGTYADLYLKYFPLGFY